jgi:hypothetical protein
MSMFKRSAPAPAPVAPVATAPAPPKRTIDPIAYGFVPQQSFRSDRAGPSPDPDTLDTLLATRDTQGMSRFIAGLPLTSERRFAAIVHLGHAASKDDSWLQQWLREDPTNVAAITALAESTVDVAWAIRTGSSAKDVTREQWTGFHRVLGEVPAICARATALHPADPAPFLALQNAALGLQWSNDEYRALWREVSARAPHSFTATHRAWNYWRPRWFGSLDLLNEFLETTIAAAPLGSCLTMTRLQALIEEFRPKDTAQHPAFNHSDRVNWALDCAIIDAAAADPAHVKLPYLRHWLAWQLVLSGRNFQAMEQFRAIGGFAGAPPWNRFKNPALKLCNTRQEAVLAWEDAGRPPR